jgi:hypothetical protein
LSERGRKEVWVGLAGWTMRSGDCVWGLVAEFVEGRVVLCGHCRECLWIDAEMIAEIGVKQRRGVRSEVKE